MENRFQEVRNGLIASLLSLTKSSKFLKPSEVLFLRSDLALSKKLDDIAGQTVALINDTARIGFFSTDSRSNDNDYKTVHENVDEEFKSIINLLDDFYECVDIHLDVLSKSLKKNTQNSNTATQLSLSGGNGTSLSPSHFTQPIAKPQLAFKDKVDNSNIPWIPIIRTKPNARRPLDSTEGISEEVRNHLFTLGHASPLHPYKFEIENIEYQSDMQNSTDPVKFKDLEHTPLNIIDNLTGLESLINSLNCSKEFAVDLEHHDYRSFQGFTCLVQISTRAEDFVIDALKLRHELFRLNEPFTNPKIIKVFHGAEMDIIWLQRDFGVYVVNLFDTFHASHCLEMEKHSLAFLLDKYCNIQADKKYQRADWRQRPLSQEMIRYARSDTHYLLYIFDLMKNELVEKSDNLLKVTFERSAETSLKTYEKPSYDAERGEGNGGWKNLLRRQPEALNEENFAVFRAVHGWRDHIARTEDESPAYVMPNHIIFKLARFMPTNAKDLVAGCTPVPPLTRAFATDIAKLIEKTLQGIREKMSASSIPPATDTSSLPFSSLPLLSTRPSFTVPTLSAPSTGTNLILLDRKQSSKVFGNLFNREMNSQKAHELASKIGEAQFLLAPSSFIEEAVNAQAALSTAALDEAVEPAKHTSQTQMVMKEEKSQAFHVKRTQFDDSHEIKITLSASTHAKMKTFDFESAKEDIAKEKSSHHTSFDPQTEESDITCGKKAKKLKTAHKNTGRSGHL